MTWEGVQVLRKSGKFQQAVDFGLQGLAEAPEDFKLRTQLDWAFYGLVKTHVSGVVAKLKAGQPAPSGQTTRCPTFCASSQRLRRILLFFRGSSGGLVSMDLVQRIGSTANSMKVVSRQSRSESRGGWQNGRRRFLTRHRLTLISRCNGSKGCVPGPKEMTPCGWIGTGCIYFATLIAISRRRKFLAQS